MKRSVVETILGAVVIAVAVVFLVYGYKTGGAATPSGYEITADFSSIGGLKAGDQVQVGGVPVGTVAAVGLVPGSYLARVHMSIEQSLRLPEDTTAIISSESLLGGHYLQLEPGADEQMIKPGGRVQYTQAPQNLEQLLGQFIFSVQDAKKKDAKE